MPTVVVLLLLGQLSVSGTLASVAPPAGTAPVRWPDVAYDASDDVFLGVSGAGAILGQYFTSAGAPSGAAFAVNSGTVFGQAPRVAYAPDLQGFLVAWHETIGNDTRIRGRIIRHGKAALTNDFDVSPFGTNWEMGAALAYATTAKEFLVAWQDRATTQIHAQRVSGAGAPVGAKLVVEVVPYARDPAVSYDPTTDRFLVAYGGCVGTDDCFIRGQRNQAGPGALVGTPISVEAPITAGYVPELAYDAAKQRTLCVWFRSDGANSGLYGKLIDAAGTSGALLPIAPKAGSYDANSVAWNPISGTFAVVTHGGTSQDLMIEVGADGATSFPTTQAFGTTTGNGNFNPRVATATSKAKFLGVTSRAFGSFDAQLVVTATRPGVVVLDAGVPDAGQGVVDAGMPDAGTPDSGTPDAGTTGDAGTGRPDPGTRDGGTSSAVELTGGCGCTSAEGPGAVLLLLLVAARRPKRTPLPPIGFPWHGPAPCPGSLRPTRAPLRPSPTRLRPVTDSAHANPEDQRARGEGRRPG